MFVMTDGLARLLAPILSFSMEELWRYLPGKRDESVHLALFPPSGDIDSLIDHQLLDTWKRLLDIRSTVNNSLEAFRQSKQIGNALQAHVTVTATGDDLALLRHHEAQLPMLFIVSGVAIKSGEFGVTVERAPGVKCERCWRYVSTMSTDPAQAGICDRCQDALAETVTS